MAIIKDAPFLSPAELFPHQQKTWLQQKDYVQMNSGFHQQLWAGKNPPDDLRDLPELPLSEKAQIRISQENFPPFGNYLAASHDTVNRLHRTSGTSGQAMNLGMSAKDCEMTEIVGARCQSSAGLGPVHTVVHCLNYQMWMGGLTDHMTLERTGATVIPFGVGGTDLLIRTIRELGVTAISCTPSYPAVLERVINEKFPDLAPHDLGLKLGLFGGEPGLDDPTLRERIKEKWGLEPRNANYGVSDVFCNFASQCEYDTRLHFLAADVLYPELIHPETEAPLTLQAGQQGELVLTHLARDCQPLVRFRTGDIISVDETEPCHCGRTGFRFRVIGRSDDMVVVRGINLFPTMVASVINGFTELSGNYRIVLDSAPPYDFLPLHVELEKGTPVRTEIGIELQNTIKSQLGASTQVTLLPESSFQISEGKTKRVLKNYL